VATQAERRAATRSTLVHHARASFGTVGFDNVTIDELASLAEVTRGALYHHFASKEALFEVVFRDVEAMLLGVVTRASDGIDDPRLALKAGARAYVRGARKPDVVRIALIDAPAVLGWANFHRIDESYFLPGLIAAVHAIRPTSSARSNELMSRALFAAICELALQAGTSRYATSDVNTTIDAFIGAL
jgi:AcrR family transcriptional regulator